MELKKVDCGVWVKASEELSLHYEDVFIQWNGSKIVAYYDNSIKQYRSGTRVYNISEVEWLKPIEQALILTEDEILQVFRAGYRYYRDFVNKIPYDEVAEEVVKKEFVKQFINK